MTGLAEYADLPGERSLALLLSGAACGLGNAVSVTVLNGRVIVEGHAPSYAAKELASETLRRAGYTDIDNRLRVSPGMPPGHI